MANEITFGWKTGVSLEANAYQPTGSQRGSTVTMAEIGSTGLYTGSHATIVTGDLVMIDDGTNKVGWGEWNPSVILSSDGLDTVSTTEPSGVASNFREMVVQLWRRFFGKTTFSKTQILHYKIDGINVATTQEISETSTLQTQGESS